MYIETWEEVLPLHLQSVSMLEKVASQSSRTIFNSFREKTTLSKCNISFEKSELPVRGVRKINLKPITQLPVFVLIKIYGTLPIEQRKLLKNYVGVFPANIAIVFLSKDLFEFVWAMFCTSRYGSWKTGPSFRLRNHHRLYTLSMKISENVSH